MKITKKWLRETKACAEGVDWFNSQKETDSIKVLKKLIKKDKLDWANWTICRVFNRKQRIQYAVFAAEQVFHLWKDKHPKEAAVWRKWVDNGCAKDDAASAYDAAYAAADDAAYAAAYDAAYAAAYAASAAYAAAYAASAASAAKKQLKLKILNYGLNLLKGGDKG